VAVAAAVAEAAVVIVAAVPVSVAFPGRNSWYYYAIQQGLDSIELSNPFSLHFLNV